MPKVEMRLSDREVQVGDFVIGWRGVGHDQEWTSNDSTFLGYRVLELNDRGIKTLATWEHRTSSAEPETLYVWGQSKLDFIVLREVEGTKEEIKMPEPVEPVVYDPTTEKLVKANLVRDKGKLYLRLDCTGLHKYLMSLGVQRDSYYKRFEHCPNGRSDIIDTNEHAVMPRALCTFNVVNGVINSQLEWDLLKYYGSPPTLDAMKLIAESVKKATTAVVEHYQPVEITINVVGRKPKAP